MYFTIYQSTSLLSLKSYISSTSYSSYLSINIIPRKRLYYLSKRSYKSSIRSNIYYTKYIFILARSLSLYTYKKITLIIRRLLSFFIYSFLLSLLIQIFFIFKNTLLLTQNIRTGVCLQFTPSYQYYQALQILLLIYSQIFLISQIYSSQFILSKSSSIISSQIELQFY